MRQINKILVTCTESNKNLGLKQVKEKDLQAGLQNIGCHYLITRDGKVHKGRPNNEVGSTPHYTGRDALIIQLVGQGWDFTHKQLNALMRLEETVTEAVEADRAEAGFECEVYEYLPVAPKASNQDLEYKLKKRL